MHSLNKKIALLVGMVFVFSTFLTDAAFARAKIFTPGESVDNTSVKDAVKEAKDKLIKREPPAEPFTMRAAWCSSKVGESVDWNQLISVNEGRLLIKKGIQLEAEEDKIVRAKNRTADQFNSVSVVSKTDGNCDGVQILYWKPLLKTKEEIKFSINSKYHTGEHTFKELQDNALFMEEMLDLGNGNKGTLYADIINYDTARGNFDKFRTQLIFVTWGDVENKVESSSDLEETYRDYIVKVGQKNANDLRMSLVGTLYYEDNELHIDKVVKGEGAASDEIITLSTVGKDFDGMIVALEGRRNYGEDVLPFQQRGLHVRVEEISAKNLPDRASNALDTETPETVSFRLASTGDSELTNSGESGLSPVSGESGLNQTSGESALDSDKNEFVNKDLKEIVKEKSKIEIDTAKVVFDKVYNSHEDFGLSQFTNVSGNVPHGIRVLSGTFAWQNTPNIMKVYLVASSARKAARWFRSYATPWKVASLAAVSASTAIYMQNVVNMMFGEDYALSKSQLDSIAKIVDKQAEAMAKAVEDVAITEEFENCETQEECQKVIDDANLEEEVEKLAEDNAEELQKEVEKQETSETPEVVAEQYNEGTIPFKDVPQTTGGKATWFLPYVQASLQYGIVNGYKDALGKKTGMYGPSDNVTNAALWKMAVFSTGLANKYGPVDETKGATWYQTYIDVAAKAKEEAVKSGNEELAKAYEKVIDLVKNQAGEPASRDSLAGFFVTALEVFPEEPTNPHFPDTSACAWNWQIEYLYNLGVVAGKGESGKYHCGDLMNRAEAAKVASAVAEIAGATGEADEIIKEEEE